MKKFKLKIGLKYAIKLIATIFVVLFLIVAPVTIFPQILASQNNVNRNVNYSYLGILEMWHIESFEGGSVSRGTWLDKRAIAFEEIYKGTYIVINTLSVEQAQLNIQAGKKPDIISFSAGTIQNLVEELVPLNFSGTVRQDLIEAGKFNGKQLALPYILGGYSFISQPANDKSITGLNGLNTPLTACLIGSNTNNTFSELCSSSDSFSAYDLYLKGKAGVLLGTQRDVYRINNRVEKGSLTNQTFNFLGGFSDLVQYVGICKTDSEREAICENFVKYLLSQQVQQSLSNINMFSTLNNISLYTSGCFADMEKVLQKPLQTYSAFIAKEKLLEINSISLKAVNGDKDATNNILGSLI